MAKKVKFPLKMADGTEARTLDELREHFDSESVVGYFHDGRLLTWLRSRYYDDEADKVASLTKDDPQLYKKLCAIFGVEAEVEELDTEEIARRQERLNRLKQYTYDKEVLERVDLVAFDQEDLSDLLDEDKPLIYLCGNKFVIPLRETHKTYIGVGKAIAVIRSNKIVNFDELNIEFKNVLFDDNYEALLKEQKRTAEKKVVEEKASLPQKLYDEGEAALLAEDYEIAMEKYKQAVELDYPRAFSGVGFLYLRGFGVDKDINEARRWYKLGMEKNDENSFFSYIYTFAQDNSYNILSTEKERREAFKFVMRIAELAPENHSAINGLAYCYEIGVGVNKNPEKAFELYERAAKAGNVNAMFHIASMFEYGNGVRKNLRKAVEWFKKAAEAGDENAYYYLGDIYYDGFADNDLYDEEFLNGIYSAEERELKDNQKAGEYFRKGADAGDSFCMWQIARMCEDGIGMKKNAELAFKWYLRSAEAGNSLSMAEVGKCYLEGRGTKKNRNDAEYWLKKAANEGNGMKEYADLLFERYNPDSLDWYKKAFENIDVSQSYNKEKAGEIAYKIYKIFNDGLCGIEKSKSDANYWKDKYKSLGYKPDDDGCFITTAVCDSLGKPDDCSELTTFRKFRDGWLSSQPDGKNLIAEYYSVAPAIVAKINSLPNAAQVYDNIWQKYLEPCLTFIERGDNQSCKRLYVEMVTSLKKKFLGD